MKVLFSLYRQHIYGIIGTLIFHILLFGVLLFKEIDLKQSIKEEPIVIDFSEEIKDLEMLKEQTVSAKLNSPDNMTNLASNRSQSKIESTTSTDKFFNSEYQKELNEAQNLVSNVNKQLSKEKIDIKDIKMPVQVLEEGKNPDSVKNVIYSGESNIVYFLENRYHTSLPIPVYLSQTGGKIIVDIVVDRNGNVIKASPRTNSNEKEDLVYYARIAAERTRFNIDQTAPNQQKGTIQYTFKAQ